MKYDYKALDRQRLLRLNLHNRANGEKQFGPEDDTVDSGDKFLSRPGVYDWELAPKPELASLGQVWVVTKDTTGTLK